MALKLTESQLRKIIREEIETASLPQSIDQLLERGKGTPDVDDQVERIQDLIHEPPDRSLITQVSMEFVFLLQILEDSFGEDDALLSQVTGPVYELDADGDRQGVYDLLKRTNTFK